MEYREQIEQIRYSYLKGEITLEQAQEKVQPLLAEMNEKGAAIAKKFGKKFNKLTFQYVFR